MPCVCVSRIVRAQVDNLAAARPRGLRRARGVVDRNVVDKPLAGSLSFRPQIASNQKDPVLVVRYGASARSGKLRSVNPRLDDMRARAAGPIHCHLNAIPSVSRKCPRRRANLSVLVVEPQHPCVVHRNVGNRLGNNVAHQRKERVFRRRKRHKPYVNSGKWRRRPMCPVHALGRYRT